MIILVMLSKPWLLLLNQKHTSMLNHLSSDVNIESIIPLIVLID